MSEQQVIPLLDPAHILHINQCLETLRLSENLVERKKAASAIINYGEPAISFVIPHALHEHTRRLDMLRVLVNIGSTPTIDLILDHIGTEQFVTGQNWEKVKRHHQLLKELVAERCSFVSHEDISILVRIIKIGSSNVYFFPVAMIAANGLLQLAEREPSRKLLPALEALRAGFVKPSAPLEFIPIRIRLGKALKRLNNLPIPAAAPEMSVADLPIPVEALDD